MKTFETLLQNACEDYFSQFDRQPTLEDIAEVCSTPIANVVWKAVRIVCDNLDYQPAREQTVNGVSLTKIKECFNQTCKHLLGRRVGDRINLIIHLFKLCPRYGFEFHYGTKSGLHTSLQHSYEDDSIIIGAGFSKIKNNKILVEKR